MVRSALRERALSYAAVALRRGRPHAPLPPSFAAVPACSSTAGRRSLTTSAAAGVGARKSVAFHAPSASRLACHQQVRCLNRVCGLVGYPNVGKSTLFNAFVGSSVAAAENFPFCTIEPNVVKVGVPDARIEALAKACGAAKTVPGTVEIRDIAGLIKGASTGAGMGNAFLGQIRGVQVVFHVVRCFSDPAIVHVEVFNTTEPTYQGSSIGCEMNKFTDMMSYLAARDPEFEQVIAVDPGFDIFNRAWCVAEIAEAHAVGMTQQLKIMAKQEISSQCGKLKGLKVQDMQASRPEDVQEILSRIPDHDEFNDQLQHLIFGEGVGLLCMWLSAEHQMERAGRFARFHLLETGSALVDVLIRSASVDVEDNESVCSV